MHTIEDIRSEMKKLDMLSGIDTSKIHVRISSKMTRTFGRCISERSGGAYSVKELVFADRFMRYATKEHFLNTVRHEYAHAFVTLYHKKFDHHGPLWKSAAIRFGCTGDRCSSMPEVPTSLREKRYKLSCPNGDWSYEYTRAGKTVQHFLEYPSSGRYCCPICGSKQLKLEVKNGS